MNEAKMNFINVHSARAFSYSQRHNEEDSNSVVIKAQQHNKQTQCIFYKRSIQIESPSP